MINKVTIELYYCCLYCAIENECKSKNKLQYVVYILHCTPKHPTIVHILIIVCLSILLITIIIKLFFWNKIPNKNFASFIRSFRKYFNVIDLHNTQNIHNKRFRIISNYCNLLFWLSIIGLIVLFYFDVIEIDVPKK